VGSKKKQRFKFLFVTLIESLNESADSRASSVLKATTAYELGGSTGAAGCSDEVAAPASVVASSVSVPLATPAASSLASA